MSATPDVVVANPEVGGDPTPEVTPVVDPTVDPKPAEGDPKATDGDGDSTPEPEQVTISAENLRELERVRKEWERTKPVLGKQAEEITRLKEEKGEVEPEPAPRRTRTTPAKLTADEDGMVTYDGRRMEIEHAEELRSRDERLRGVEARLDADDQRREGADKAQRERAQQKADMEVRQSVADTYTKAGVDFLKVGDEKVAAAASKHVEAHLWVEAAERGVPLEDLTPDELLDITKAATAETELMLGYRHREQDADNDKYRTDHPGKTAGAPGVPTDRLPKDMTPEEKLRAFEAVSQAHSTGAT